MKKQILQIVSITFLALFLTACGGGGSGNDTTPTNTNDTNTSNETDTNDSNETNTSSAPVDVKIAVATQSLNLNFDENKYMLVAGDESVEFSSGNTTKTLNLEPKDVEIVALTKEDGTPVLMSYDNTKDEEVDLSIESSADVFVMRSPRFYGVQISNMEELSKRIRAHERYPEVVEAIEWKLSIDSPCPMDGACNTTATRISEIIAQDLEFSDLIKQ
jgi:hypothetical protein